ncbi:DUF3667 domain-containing protein [Marivirga atlantica]|jgi:hypothetical protein|uniref:DUF3667 domain-containing protein n=1 Tax=Marivirga atlantica TaxID=1548457 RepID=A0A937A7M9_9BACT|nr:DUF3667 domain-containing protein [Marivirga atlantica]MBL0765232.1 DUF3667 domain-containing protein [Marivirga atlantica]
MVEEKVRCLNCAELLTKDQNYCPNCGQENTIKKLPIGAFIQDFLSNYLSFDTVLSKTLYPFIFKPGKLTKDFNEGKRKRYINPIRLYLLFSLFFFFMVGLLVPNDFTKGKGKLTDKELVTADSVSNIYIDSLSKDLDFKNVVNPKEIKKDAEAGWLNLKQWAKDDTLSDQGFQENLQSININVNDFNAKAFRNFLAEPALFTYKATRNLPVLMFFLLPLFALILKLFYFRRFYYIEHVIHGLHLHAFAYFIYGLGILLMSTFDSSENWILFAGFSWVSLYTLFSMKRLYPGSWGKTFIKFLTLGFFYFIFLLFGFVLELYVSLAFI